MSEIILLRDSAGALRYTGWFRRRVRDGGVLFTGFYMMQRIPKDDVPCVKAVFPMPDGSATVILRPENEGAGFLLTSAGPASVMPASTVCNGQAMASVSGGSATCTTPSASTSIRRAASAVITRSASWACASSPCTIGCLHDERGQRR
jgi:hypothetical protein